MIDVSHRSRRVWVDMVDSVAYTVSVNRTSPMTSAALRQRREKSSPKQLLDKVRSLRAEARVVEGLFPSIQGGASTSMIATGSSTSAVRKELETLERTIQRIRQRIEAAAPTGSQFPEAARATKAMVSRKELLESAQFADALGWTRQALSKALAARRVFFIDHEGARYFPAFYADPRYERRQLEAVTKLLGDLPGGSKLQFFLNARGSLAKLTPLEALLKGQLAAVKAAAEGFAQG
jgi:hypothetical protein